MCKTTPQQRQDQDLGKPEQNHSLEKPSQELPELFPCSHKNIFYGTGPIKLLFKDWGKPMNHSLANARPIPGVAYSQPDPSKGITNTRRYLFPMHTHSPAKARPRPKEARAHPQPSKGKTKSRESLFTTTPQQRQDQNRGKPRHNHSYEKATPRPRKSCAQPPPGKGDSKTWESLFITTAKQRYDQDWGKPDQSHSSANPRPILGKPVHNNRRAKARPKPRKV